MNANNVVLLQGRVSSVPRLRELPSGAAIVNLEITTQVDDAALSVPVVYEGASVDCSAGDDVVVVGHVRRRFFRAGGVTQSRTEVLAERVVRASRSRAAHKLIEGVMAVLEAA
jgi:single-strand DNA-binding protein